MGRGRYIIEYSIYGDRYDAIGKEDNFRDALKCVMDTYVIVKNCKCASFRVKDRLTNINTYMELGDKGISIFSNIPKKEDGLVHELGKVGCRGGI